MANFDRIFGQPSARVVALARVGLAAIFLLGTVADPPEQGSLTIAILAVFCVFSIAVAAATWRNWWIDARIAAATHLIDMCFFVAVVGPPQGYSSPYFLFFVFLLLSSAIRWSWRETAMTAAVVIALYVFAGLVVGLSEDAPFDARRFIIRSGYLMILSIVLIWFGVRRRFSSAGSLPDPAPSRSISDDRPLATALKQLMRATGADHAQAYWNWADGAREALEANGEDVRLAPAAGPGCFDHAFLFDAAKDRALVNTGSSGPQFTTASAILGRRSVQSLAPHQGIAIPVESKLGRGLFLLFGIRDLHSDHLSLGDRLRSELAFLIERYALFSALRDGAIANERLQIARNLHDGIVQFLAGSAYKIEAISRSSATGHGVSNDLQDLKQLMLLEQEDLRSSIGTLRQEKVNLSHTGSEAEALCSRLSRQWRIQCNFASELTEVLIPARLHMDVLHMIKEGVANAVRHGSATTVDIRLQADRSQLDLTVRNDDQADSGHDEAVPWSIRERMGEIGGSASVTAANGTTTLLVGVPIPQEKE